MQSINYRPSNATTLCITIISIFMISACTINNKQETIQNTAPSAVLPTALPIQIDSTPIPKSATAAPSPTTTPTQNNDSYLETLLPDCFNTEFSPDQKWAVGYCGDDETWVVNTEQTAKWTISYGEYYGSKVDSGIGVITPEYWSADGTYLYLAIQRGVSGPIYFASGWGVIRLDLKSGEYFDILEPLQHGFYSFSISPDGEQLAYIYQNNEPMILKIRSLKSEDIENITLNAQYDQAGGLLWSQDKSKLAFALVNVDYNGVNPDLFSVEVANLENKSTKLLIQENLLEMRPKTWVDENIIELEDVEGKTWLFNMSTNSLLEKTQ